MLYLFQTVQTAVAQIPEIGVMSSITNYGVPLVITALAIVYIRQLVNRNSDKQKELDLLNVKLNDERIKVEAEFRKITSEMHLAHKKEFDEAIAKERLAYDKLNCQFLDHIKSSEATLLLTTQNQADAFLKFVESYEKAINTSTYAADKISAGFDMNSKVIELLIPILNELTSTQKKHLAHVRRLTRKQHN